MADETGATPNERLLFAAKQDLEELFLEVEEEGGYDVNFKDGLGNTAMHYAVVNLSACVLDMLLEEEGADVDLINNQGQTPLHSAMEIQRSDPRYSFTKTLLEAGADPRVRNPKTGQKPIDILKLKMQAGYSEAGSDKSIDEELMQLLKNAEASMDLDPDDVVDDMNDDGVDSDDVASD